MFTEAEAKTMWCPFARSIATFTVTEQAFDRDVERPLWQVAGNRIAASPFTGTKADLIPPSCRCVASTCMAWRWSDPATQRKAFMSHAEAQELGGTSAEPPTHEVPFPNRRGFCGLAGQP